MRELNVNEVNEVSGGNIISWIWRAIKPTKMGNSDCPSGGCGRPAPIGGNEGGGDGVGPGGNITPFE